MSHRPGGHGLLDVYGCPARLLRDEGYLKTALQGAAEAAGATILGGHFHTFGEGGGVTGVLLLAESHLSIHTWPEYGFAAVDIFLCGTLRMEAAHHHLYAALQGRAEQWNIQQRGRDVRAAQAP